MLMISIRRALLTVLLSIAVGVSARAADTTRYTILLDNGTRVAGEEVDQHLPNGVTKVHFTFKDNGRGPEVDEEFALAPDGTFRTYTITGHTTFGSLVNEQFSRTGTAAEWRTESDRGQTTVTGSALYVPLNSSSLASTMVAINALARRTDNALPLLPGGTLRMRTVESFDVKRGADIRRVSLIALTGLGLQPQFVWTTGIGSARRAFAFVVPGVVVGIEEGWQQTGQLLSRHQQAAEGRLLRDMAHSLRHPMDGLTVIRNAKVFDAEKAELTGPSDVYVMRGRITAVLPAGSPTRGADHEIDAGGRVLLPGLFDMHVHAGRWDGGLNVAAGVTTVRDMGNRNDTLQQIITETAGGDLLHAQIVPAGFLEGESENSASGGFTVHDLAGAREAVDWYVEHGYPQLKIYNSFPKDILRDTIAYAHSRGMRVSGHIPVFLRAQDAVEQGYDEIQHINQVLLNFLVTPTTDTRTLERFYLPAEKVAGLDFDSAPVQDFIAFLKQHTTVIDPTVCAFAFLAQKNGELGSCYAPFVDHLTLDIQRGARAAQMKIPDDATASRYQQSYNKMIEFVGRMYKAGIPLVAGTDDLPGFVLHSELAAYVQAGLTPAQVLQIATLNGARYSRTLADRGTITPGKLADLVLVDGDPTKDINDIRKVALVITQGHWLSPSEIYKSLGVKPFAEWTPAVSAIVPSQ